MGVSNSETGPHNLSSCDCNLVSEMFILICREFCKMVRKIFIYSSEEVKKMSTRCKLPASSLEGEGTVVSLDSEHRSEA